jgi:hypothetical protein
VRARRSCLVVDIGGSAAGEEEALGMMNAAEVDAAKDTSSSAIRKEYRILIMNRDMMTIRGERL